ncbi:MAG: hypothetical protein AAF171_20635 [Cyanobacteria bacterium P01_A01_bin.116]
MGQSKAAKAINKNDLGSVLLAFLSLRKALITMLKVMLAAIQYAVTIGVTVGIDDFNMPHEYKTLTGLNTV